MRLSAVILLSIFNFSSLGRRRKRETALPSMKNTEIIRITDSMPAGNLRFLKIPASCNMFRSQAL